MPSSSSASGAPGKPACRGILRTAWRRKCCGSFARSGRPRKSTTRSAGCGPSDSARRLVPDRLRAAVGRTGPARRSRRRGRNRRPARCGPAWYRAPARHGETTFSRPRCLRRPNPPRRCRARRRRARPCGSPPPAADCVDNSGSGNLLSPAVRIVLHCVPSRTGGSSDTMGRFGRGATERDRVTAGPVKTRPMIERTSRW